MGEDSSEPTDSSILTTTNQSQSTDDVKQDAVSTDYKVRGRKDAPGGTGVLGHNTASSGSSYGVQGVTDASGDGSAGELPAGVHGKSSGSGVTRGVFGEADTPSGRGVVGTANKGSGLQHPAQSNVPAGVWGATDQSTNDGRINAFGVVGLATATSGTAFGVVGQNRTPNGYAVAGEDLGGGWGVYSKGDLKVDGNEVVTGSQSVGRIGMEAELSSSSQTISPSSQTTIQFDNAVVDHFDQFDATNHEYVVPADGHYHVVASVHWRNIPGQSRHDVDIEVDGLSEVSKFQTVPGADTVSAHIVDEVTKTLYGLSKGQTVSVSVYQDSPSSVDVTDGGTYFIVNKIG